MPTYPIEPDKLLDAADRLVPTNPGRGRPPYTAHRRAVSTSYYAVFHAVGGRVSETVFPAADVVLRRRVQRWIGHSDIRLVASWVSQMQGTGGSAPQHIRRLLAPAPGVLLIDEDTSAIADGFLELHEKREQADYDHEAVFTRPDTRGLIELARQVVGVVGGAQSGEARLFFGLVGMQARIQSR